MAYTQTLHLNKFLFFSKNRLIIFLVTHIFFLRETNLKKRKKSDRMKNIDEIKLTIFPLAILIILTILWKMTNSVGSAILIIVFWMGWRQLMKKFVTK